METAQTNKMGTPKYFRAYHLTKRLRLSSVIPLFSEKPFRVSGNELIYRLGSQQYVIYYNFGSTVFFNVPSQKEEEILTVIKEFLAPTEAFLTSEEFGLEEGKSAQVEFGKVVVEEISAETVQIISWVLAQSTALEYFENLADFLLTKSGEISDSLEKKGHIGRKEKDLVKFIGICLNTKQKLISSTYILDSPDPAWEDQALADLHRPMAEMFELRERYKNLEYRLQLIQDTVEVLSDLAQNRRVYYLEFAIVLLIAVEVVLFVYDILTRM